VTRDRRATPSGPGRARARRPASRLPALLVLLLLVAAGLAALRFLPRRSLILWRWPSVGPDHVTTTAARRSPPPARVAARVYFLRIVDGKERMVPVTRQVPAAAPAAAALEELLAGKVPDGCARPLPPGVSLRRVAVAGGVATADFSRELVSGFRGGSDSEGVTVYAIVNTLTSLPGVKKVQLLVEGERVDTVGGHLDVSGPLTADRELVVSGS
jgi:germination protein M